MYSIEDVFISGLNLDNGYRVTDQVYKSRAVDSSNPKIEKRSYITGKECSVCIHYGQNTFVVQKT